MIKHFILLFIIMLFCSCEKNKDNNGNNSYFISGNVKNLADSTFVYLRVQEFDKIVNLDTTQIISNTFEFTGTNNKPEVFGIYIDSLKGSIGLFIENDSVSIEVNDKKLSDSKIKGSKLNEEYNTLISKSNKIISKINYLFPLFQKARTENNVEKLEDLNIKINTIHIENVKYRLNFARKNPDSYVAAFALQSILKENSITKDTVAIIYNSFSDQVKKGDFGIEILLYLEDEETLKN